MTDRLAAFVTPGKTLEQAVERARLAERLGYEAVFTTHIASRDALMSLAAYAHATERIRLGTAVVPAFPRHPVALALEAATLDELSGGRLILGVGPSHRVTMTNWYGLDMERPLTHLKEYVQVLLAVLREGRVEHEGAYYTSRFALMGNTPRPNVPLYLSALGPNALRFAGETADGVVLWACMPQYVEQVVVPQVREGERAAGRAEGSCEIVAAVPCGIAHDVQAARDAFRKEFMPYMTLPFYRAVIEAAGFADEIAAFDAALGAGDAAGAHAAISDRLLEDFAGIGDAATVKAKLAEYRDAGVSLPAVGLFAMPPAAGPGADATLEGAIR